MAGLDFNRTAVRLSRNPLGIIALFIVLVYAMASLVLVQAGFEARERLPLVWFLVVFPPLVLVAFVYLVAKHHTKLYAPSDFRNEQHFVSVLGTEARRRKLELEAEEVPAPAQNPEPRPAPAHDEAGGRVKQTQRPLGGATRYFIAEELALRKLETEWRVSIQREVRVGDTAVDGIAFQKDGSTVIIEVTAPRHESLAERSVLRAAEHAAAALAAVPSRGSGARFLIAVVLPDLEPAAGLSNRLSNLLRDRGFPPEVECRVFSMRRLADELGLSEPMALSA